MKFTIDNQGVNLFLPKFMSTQDISVRVHKNKTEMSLNLFITDFLKDVQYYPIEKPIKVWLLHWIKCYYPTCLNQKFL